MSQPGQPGQPGQPAAAAAPPSRLLVVGLFEDEVRARQAMEALHVWRRANPQFRVSPIAIAGRQSSGATSSRTRGVLRPRRGALVGLLIGLLLVALPAAGAAGIGGWAIGSVLFGLGGLIGVVPGDQVGLMVIELMVVSAALAALLAGALGALVGCLVGLLVGVIDVAARGLSHSESTRALAMLEAGSWAAVARVQPSSAPEVRNELARLGAVATLEAPAPPVPTPVASATPPAVSPPTGSSDRPADGAPLAPSSRER
jgi:hypothetical protein